MNKQVILIIGIIVLINLVPALTINSGECEVINLNTTEPLYWTVAGNSSSMDGINITYETYLDYINVTVCLHPMFKEDSFTLIFVDDSTKEVIKEVHHSSGGSSSRTIYVQNKTFIEVDNYIDREVIVEKEVAGEIFEVEEEEKNTKWVWKILINTFWIITGAIILFCLFIVISLMWNAKKDDTNYTIIEENNENN